MKVDDLKIIFRSESFFGETVDFDSRRIKHHQTNCENTINDNNCTFQNKLFNNLIYFVFPQTDNPR